MKIDGFFISSGATRHGRRRRLCSAPVASSRLHSWPAGATGSAAGCQQARAVARDATRLRRLLAAECCERRASRRRAIRHSLSCRSTHSQAHGGTQQRRRTRLSHASAMQTGCDFTRQSLDDCSVRSVLLRGAAGRRRAAPRCFGAPRWRSAADGAVGSPLPRSWTSH